MSEQDGAGLSDERLKDALRAFRECEAAWMDAPVGDKRERAASAGFWNARNVIDGMLAEVDRLRAALARKDAQVAQRELERKMNGELALRFARQRDEARMHEAALTEIVQAVVSGEAEDWDGIAPKWEDKARAVLAAIGQEGAGDGES